MVMDKNNKLETKIPDLQHFAVTRKCNSCIVKLQLHANTK